MTVDIEERLELFKDEIRGMFAPASVGHDVDRLNGWKRKAMADGSFGRIFNGPQWLDGIAVRDGTVTGTKLEANLVISNLFTTSATGTGARVEMDVDGIRAYNSSDINTVNIASASGAFTLRSGSTGARVELTSANGFRQYNASGTLVSQLLNDGSGFLGSTTGVASGAAFSWTTAPAVTMNGTITIGNGKIVDGDGSFWDSTGITLKATGSAGDVIKWEVSGSTKGYITADSTSFYINRSGGMGLQLTTTVAQIGGQSPGTSTLGPLVKVDASANAITVTDGNSTGTTTLMDSNGDMKVYRRLSVGNQATRYIHDANSRITFVGNVDFGTSSFYYDVQTSGGSGALPNPTKWIQVVGLAGTPYFIPVFTSRSPWTA